MKNDVTLYIRQFFAQQETILGNPTKSKTRLRLFCKHLTQQIAVLESNCSRKEIIDILNPLRHALRQSPLLQRVQDWPRGYQGDFETIESIIQYKKFAPENTLAYLFEDYFMHAPIAQQHRNKVKEQYKAIIRCIHQNPSAKILSIGCGTSEDIYRASIKIKTSKAKITLLDIDADALDYSIRKLNALKSHIHIQQGNIYKLLHQITEVYDLILIGGVFDYVSDKFIINILKKLYTHNLSNTGEICFTNIATNNPFRIPLEYFFDWFLIERSKEDIMRIVAACGIDEPTIHIEKEETQLSYIVHLCKKYMDNRIAIEKLEDALTIACF